MPTEHTSQVGLSNNTDASFADLVLDIVERCRTGELTTLDQAKERFPDHAQRLEQVWPALLGMIELGAAAGSADRSGSDGTAIELRGEAGPVGDFQILREIGRGGMGVVYEAEQISLGRRVALKVLPFAGMLDERQLQRFRNEARAAAGLHHAHIVPVYSVGCERGVHYYAMQFIEGETLAEVIAELAAQKKDRQGDKEKGRQGDSGDTAPKGKLSTVVSTNPKEWARTVARIGIEVAEALDHAHGLGVTHRDIKPANLILDKGGKVWVTDFGLAQIETDAGLTMTGDVLGTLRYMSPEQILGQRGVLDHRTDVYSLGVTLYELLALRPAFKGDNRGQLARQIAEDEPANLRMSATDVPRDLETIIFKALAKEPGDRYGSAADLAADLRRYLEYHPIRARRPSIWQRARSGARRHTGALVASLVGLSVAAVVALTAVGLLWRANIATERALESSKKSLAIAQERELTRRLHAYVPDMTAAHQLGFQDDREAMRELLARHIPSDSEQPDIRDFEWHYLWAKAHETARELPTHPGDVYNAEFSRDSKTLATACADGVVRLWNVETLAAEGELKGHQGGVNMVAFDPSDERIYSSGEDLLVRIWDRRTCRQVGQFHAHERDSLGVVFSPTGELFATGGADYKVRIWDARTNELLRTIEAHKDSIQCVAFSRDGTKLFSGCGTEPLKSWNPHTGEHIADRFGSETHGIHAVATGFEDKYLSWGYKAGADGTHKCALWSFETNSVIADLGEFSTYIESLAFHPHHKALTAVSGDGQLLVWDLSNSIPRKFQLKRLRHHCGLWCVRYSPDGRWMVTTSRKGDVMLSRVGFDETVLLQVPRDPLNSIELSRYSPDGSLVALGCNDGVTRVLDGRSLECVARLCHPAGEDSRSDISHVEMSGDNRWLASSGGGNRAKLWNISDLAHPVEVSLAGCEETFVGPFSTDSHLLALLWSNRVILWNLNERRAIAERSIELYHHLPRAAFSPQGELVVMADRASKLHFWEWQRDRSRTAEFSGAIDPIAFSPDGELLAVARVDRSISVLEAGTWRELIRLGPNQDDFGLPLLPLALAISRNGKTLAVGYHGRKDVVLWNIPTGRRVLTFRPLSLFHASSLAFSSDGSRLLCGGAAVSASFWQLVEWSTKVE